MLHLCGLFIASIAFLLSCAFAQETPHSGVLSRAMHFYCSTDDEVGCSGLYPPHSAADAQIALLTNGRRSLAARLQTLREARHFIHIQSYAYANDESGQFIGEILKQKAADGLDVRVIVDGVTNWSPGRQAYFFELMIAGVHVDGWEPEYLDRGPGLNERFHEKMWIVDGESAVVGGRNIGNNYFWTTEQTAQHWHDQDILIRGKIVSDLDSQFETNWTYFESVKKRLESAYPATERNYEVLRKLAKKYSFLHFPHSHNENIMQQIREVETESENNTFELFPSAARFIQSRPRLGERYILQAYLNLIQEARSEILIANAYFLPTSPIVEALKSAIARGVTVKVLTNSIEAQDSASTGYASRSEYSQFLNEDDKIATGAIEIYEWSGGKQGEGTLHSKYAIFDRQTSLVGSYNLDPRSENSNSETVMIFENAELSSRLASQFLEKDLAQSQRITPEQMAAYHSPRHTLSRIKTWFATHILKPLL